MTSTPHITVRTAGTAQSAATITYLRRAGVDFDTVPAEALSAVHVDRDGVSHQWHGFRPDRLAEAVADLTAVPA